MTENFSIGIVGAGTVGKAVGKGFERYGYDVTYADKGDEIVGADFQFICVPEKEVERVIQKLQNRTDLIVVKSTTPPGTVRELSKKYGCHICHNPEFLREKNAEEEFLKSPIIIIGECCEKHGNLLEKLYAGFHVPVVRTDTTTSEMVKLTTNVYFSVSLSFWQEVKLVCDKLGINSHEVGSIMEVQKLVPVHGAKMHGMPFISRCLNKDIRQMLDLSPDLKLIKAAEETNEDTAKKLGINIEEELKNL